MHNYEHIYYRDCPHFTVGRVDQWGEHGYLLYEDKVYFYEEDRKDQCGSTRMPQSIDEFLAYADEQRISIPDEFTDKLKEMRK